MSGVIHRPNRVIVIVDEKEHRLLKVQEANGPDYFHAPLIHLVRDEMEALPKLSEPNLVAGFAAAWQRDDHMEYVGEIEKVYASGWMPTEYEGEPAVHNVLYAITDADVVDAHVPEDHQ